MMKKFASRLACWPRNVPSRASGTTGPRRARLYSHKSGTGRNRPELDREILADQENDEAANVGGYSYVKLGRRV
jgi:hypothetical protein